MAEYIERAAVKKQTTYMFDEYLGTCACVLIEDIDKIPAADVVPVREGSNISQNHPVDEFVCSECGIKLRDLSEWRYDEEVGDEVLYEYECKFCPECGARIKKG